MQNIINFLSLFLMIDLGLTEKSNIKGNILQFLNNKQFNWNLECLEIKNNGTKLSNDIRMTINNKQIFFQYFNKNNQVEQNLEGNIQFNNFSEAEMQQFLTIRSQYDSVLLNKINDRSSQNTTDTAQIQYQIHFLFYKSRLDPNIDFQDFTIEISSDNIQCQSELLLGWEVKEYAQLHYQLFCGISCLLLLVTFIATISLIYEYFKYRIATSKFSIIAVFISTVQQATLFEYFFFSIPNNDHAKYYIPPLLMQQACHLAQLAFSVIVQFKIQFFQLIKRRFSLSITTIICFLICYSLGLFFNLLLYEGYWMRTNSLYIFQFLLPFLIQIIHNAFFCNDSGLFKSNYMFMLSIRLLFILYFEGCPENDLELEPNYLYCIIILAAFVIFMIVLYLQSKFGPITFIRLWMDEVQPDELIQPFQPFGVKVPNFDSYIKEIEMDDSYVRLLSIQGICSICLSSLLLEANEDDDKLEQIICPLFKSIMITPCQHKFHINCLNSWLKVQKVCPVCRKMLLPLRD